MRLAALLLVATGLGAQTITNYRVVDYAPNAVLVGWTVASNPGSSLIEFDSGTSAGSLTDSSQDITSSSNGSFWNGMYAAQGGQTRYYQITFASTPLQCTGACTNCDSGDAAIFGDTNEAGINGGTGSGWNCDGASEPPWITHPASAAVDPDAPTHSVSDIYALYDGAGETVTETDSTCANIGTTLTAQKDDGNVQIINVTDYTSVCNMDNWSLPTHTSDYVVIRPKLPASLRLTKGARAGLEHAPMMLVIESNFPADHASISGTSFVTLQDKYIFENVWIRGPIEPYNPRQATVTNVSGGTLTLDSCPTGLTAFDHVWLDLPGMTAYPAVSYATGNCSGGSVTLTGTFTGSLSSNGTLSFGENVPISSVSATNPIEITTAVPHGLPQDAAAVTQDFLFVGAVEGITSANGTHVYTVIDADTFSIAVDGTMESYEASDFDFIRFGSGPRGHIDAVGETDVYFVQSILGTPWYGNFHYGFGNSFTGASRVGVVDSLILTGGMAALVDPDTGDPKHWYAGSRVADSFRLDGCQDCQFRNLSISAATVGTGHFNAQNTNRQTLNITIQAVEAIVGDYGHAGANFSPDTLGLYSFDPRQCTEWKGGVKYLWMDGFSCIGAAIGSVFDATGYAHFFANTVESAQDTDDRANQHIRIEWNKVVEFASPFGFGGQQTQHGTNWHGLNKEILIENSFFNGDNLGIIIDPDDGFTIDPLSGFQFTARMGIAGLAYRNNTNWYANGDNSDYVIAYQGDRAPECDFSSNIFFWHGNAGITNYNAAVFGPITTTDEETRFASWCPGGSFDANLVVPGIENPSNMLTDDTSTSDAATKTIAECEARWEGLGGLFTDVVCGPTGNAYSDRHDALFPSGAVMPEATFGAYGISDYNTWRRHRGKVAIGTVPGCANPGACQTEADEVTVVLDAPTTTACAMRASDNSFATDAESASAAGGSNSQTIVLSGLTPLTAYEFLLECPGGETRYMEYTLQ